MLNTAFTTCEAFRRLLLLSRHGTDQLRETGMSPVEGRVQPELLQYRCLIVMRHPQSEYWQPAAKTLKVE